MKSIRQAWRALVSDEVLFTSPEIGRVFMRCYQCNRVRPAWDLIKKPPFKRLGCQCGARQQRPANLPWWLAMWWLLVRGVVWRKWIRRRLDWDPRMPMRDMKPGEF